MESLLLLVWKDPLPLRLKGGNIYTAETVPTRPPHMFVSVSIVAKENEAEHTRSTLQPCSFSGVSWYFPY